MFNYRNIHEITKRKKHFYKNKRYNEINYDKKEHVYDKLRILFIRYGCRNSRFPS